MSEPAWLAADLGAADLSPCSRADRMRHSPQKAHSKEEDGKVLCHTGVTPEAATSTSAAPYLHLLVLLLACSLTAGGSS